MLHRRPVPRASVRDGFWAWGHCPGAHNADYNLPGRSAIGPADGAASLGLANLLMVRYGRCPLPPYQALAETLRPLRQVVWSVVGAGGLTSSRERAEVLALSRTMPNLRGILFDDFWGGSPENTSGEPILTEAEVAGIRQEAGGLDLWCVYYVRELFRVEIRGYIPLFDRHTLWTWDPFHLRSLGDKLDRFEAMIPGGQRYMGVYLWDYGRSQPVPLPLIQQQCRDGLERMRSGRLSGMIFLATCLCDLDIRAVDWVRGWISEVGDIPLGVPSGGRSPTP